MLTDFTHIYAYVANGFMLILSYFIIYQIIKLHSINRRIQHDWQAMLGFKKRQHQSSGLLKKIIVETTQMGNHDEIVDDIVYSEYAVLKLLRGSSTTLGMAFTILSLMLFGLDNDQSAGVDSLISLFTVSLSTTFIGAINAMMATAYLSMSEDKMRSNGKKLWWAYKQSVVSKQAVRTKAVNA